MVHRHIHRNDFGELAIRGVMEGGGVVMYTLEDPEDHIPPGEYLCTRDHYHKGNYPTFLVHAEGRSRILFHKGNTHLDTRGCILVGTSRGTIDGVPAVLGSTAAFMAFMDLLDGVDEFTLTISDDR